MPNPARHAAPSSPPPWSAAVLDRARGALLGLAVGDALGTTLEFERRDRRPLHAEMLGGGPFALEPGQWTDDTAMALALADSLVACRGFDPADVMTRFVAWWREGAYSCTGTCFDIGITTAAALARYEQTGEPFSGSTDEHLAGNGSIMRAAPIALFSLHDESQAAQLAKDQSRLTHSAPACLEACALLVDCLCDLIHGRDAALRSRRPSAYPALRDIAAGAWWGKTRGEIRSTGYVVDTLEAALWCVATTESFEDALVRAVNLAGDADTVGAVTGQLAGACYGASAIPERWLKPLAWRDRMSAMADQLLRDGSSMLALKSAPSDC